jgi:hypothetical protein
VNYISVLSKVIATELHNEAGDDAFKESTDFLVMPAKAGIQPSFAEVGFPLSRE